MTTHEFTSALVSQFARRLALADLPLGLSTTKLTIDAMRLRPRRATERFFPTTEAVRRTVLQRDHATCRACGFSVLRNHEVVCVGSNALDLDDLVTLCSLCAQCFRVDRIAELSGKLVYLPDISQAELHWLVRDLYVTRSRDSQHDAVNAALRRLSASAVQACARIEVDSPVKLGRLLEDAVEKGRAAVLGRRIEGVRLLPLEHLLSSVPGKPDHDVFPQLLAIWSATRDAWV